MKPIINIFSVFLSAVLISSFTVNMQARDLTLEECLDSAFVFNRRMQVGNLQIQKAEIMKGTAFDPDYTSVLLKQETTGGGGPENGIMFSQDFDFPTVYIAKSRSLKARETLERSNRSETRNALIAEITAEYQNALYYRELLDINRQTEETFTMFRQLAEARYAGGECSRLEVINAERSLEDCLREKKELLTALDNSLLKITFLTGCEEKVTIPQSVEFQMSLPSTVKSDFDYNETPRGEIGLNSIKIVESEVNLETQRFFPSLTFGVTVQAVIKSFNPYHVDRARFRQGNFMGFEAGINLPVFFWAQNSRLKAAKTELAAARMQYEYDAGEAENEFTSLLSQLHTSYENLISFREQSLSKAEEIIRLSKISYEYGEIDYVEYVNNIESAYQIRKNYAEELIKYNRMVVKLNYLSGKQ